MGENSAFLHIFLSFKYRGSFAVASGAFFGSAKLIA
jgi:hypothetical protein